MLLENINEFFKIIQDFKTEFKLDQMLSKPQYIEPFFLSLFYHLQFSTYQNHGLFLGTTHSGIVAVLFLKHDYHEEIFSRVFMIDYIATDRETNVGNILAHVFELIIAKDRIFKNPFDALISRNVVYHTNATTNDASLYETKCLGHIPVITGISDSKLEAYDGSIRLTGNSLSGN